MQHQHESKTKLLDATLKVVRAKGYSATRIEDVCAEAGLTKGSFFHHFKSKEDLALSAIAHWDATTSALFAEAPYHDPADPLSRVIAYIEFRKALLTGDLPDFTCFVGTIVQEAYQTHPEVSVAAARVISGHAKTLRGRYSRGDARARCRPEAGPPESLALAFPGGDPGQLHPGEGERKRRGGCRKSRAFATVRRTPLPRHRCKSPPAGNAGRNK